MWRKKLHNVEHRLTQRGASKRMACGGGNCHVEREEIVSWLFGLTPFAFLWLRVPDERRRPALVFLPLTFVELWFGGYLADINYM